MLAELREKKANRKFDSVAEIILHRVLDTPDDVAFTFPKVGPDGSETWAEMRWKEVETIVRQVAASLRDAGVEIEDRCAILAQTRIAWILADLGISCVGGACTTIYPSNTPEECGYILIDSGTKLVFAEDDGQIAKLLEIRDTIPHVEKVVTFDGTASADGWIVTWDDFLAAGKASDAANPAAFTDRIARIRRDHLTTLIYTSGTTGVPKGVELLNDCWIYIAEAMDSIDIFEPDDKQFLWLPMSHSFGKVLEMILIASNIPTAVDGRIPKIIENLSVIRPTWMAAAPRIFEKAYNKIVTDVEKQGGLKETIFKWALGVGRRVSAVKQRYEEPSGLLALQFKIADKLVFSKVKARFGGRVKFFISGSAPLSKDMAEFFHACGILILEGYGLTESSAASFVNRPESFAFGTVGVPVPDTQVRITPDSGEILIKSRGIMRGYWNKPKDTADTLVDGWLRTGDKGELDATGRLKITGRIKELIKTSGGKYVAPAAIESRLKALCPYLSEVVVHGDNRNFCTALVTLSGTIYGWAAEHGYADKDVGGATIGELGANPVPATIPADSAFTRAFEFLAGEAKVKELVQRSIDQLNDELPSYSTVKYFAILPRDFSVEDGELTASLKVKRRHVEQKYMDILDAFYGDQLKKLA